MKHLLESLLVSALAGGVRVLTPAEARRAGAAAGELARRLKLRREVAEANLARAFPERSAEEREGILAAHYRELGRVAFEYPRLPELVRTEDDSVVAAVRGLEHLDRAYAAGRGAILLTGHFGNFELLGAWLGRRNPVDFVVKPLSNPRVEAMIARWRRGAGVSAIPVGAGVRGVFESLKRNRWVAMLADQDAREHGVFVPFFGIESSTPSGPAAIAIKTGAALVMGFVVRRADGRHELTIPPPLEPVGRGPDAVRDLTARHTAALEQWVRKHPEMWFWLHRRWKTAPPGGPRG